VNGGKELEIRDKVVLVTGASAGIGRATAELLGRAGARVALAARSEDKLRELESQLPDSFAVPVEMTDPESVRAMVKSVHDHYGRIDVLVNNAGRGMMGPIEAIDLDDLKYLTELNVYGPLIAMQSVIPLMRAQGGGAIVNISSALSKMSIPSLGGYASTKYALNALSYTACAELGGDNITVTAVYPNMTATEFNRNAISSGSTAWTPPRGGDAPVVDTPETVADRILDAIEKGPAEQYIDEAQRQRVAAMSPGGMPR
jgi:short-subunit dehydrogenase